jgi:hypothetical protein
MYIIYIIYNKLYILWILYIIINIIKIKIKKKIKYACTRMWPHRTHTVQYIINFNLYY